MERPGRVVSFCTPPALRRATVRNTFVTLLGVLTTWVHVLTLFVLAEPTLREQLFVSISGIIGAGKTTLATALAKELDVRTQTYTQHKPITDCASIARHCHRFLSIMRRLSTTSTWRTSTTT